LVRDDDGKVNTVRYEAVNAMLLNEFLKEHRKVEEQADEIAQTNRCPCRHGTERERANRNERTCTAFSHQSLKPILETIRRRTNWSWRR
jgi:hypothetical protein